MASSDMFRMNKCALENLQQHYFCDQWQVIELIKDFFTYYEKDVFDEKSILIHFLNNKPNSQPFIEKAWKFKMSELRRLVIWNLFEIDTDKVEWMNQFISYTIPKTLEIFALYGYFIYDLYEYSLELAIPKVTKQLCFQGIELTLRQFETIFRLMK